MPPIKRKPKTSVDETNDGAVKKKLHISDASALDAISTSSNCREIISKINDAMTKILSIKKDDFDADAVKNLRAEVIVLFSFLKRINRNSHVQCKAARDHTLEIKQKVDGVYLELLNEQYEISHLKKEISRCLDYKSKRESINLISEEEFYKAAPASISKPEETKGNEHLLTLARLEFELSERKRLNEARKIIEHQRNELLREIDTKKSLFDSFLPRLESIINVAKPLEEELGISTILSDNFEKHFHLPTPLYILYTQLKGYAGLCDRDVSVKIEGGVVNNPSRGANVDSDDDDEDRMSQQSGSVNKTYPDSKKKLSYHSLKVILNLSCDEINVVLTFSYCMSLDVTFVSIAHSEKFIDQSILHSLYESDTSECLPNPASNFVSGENDTVSVSNDAFTFCYKWVQLICGRDYVQHEAKPQWKTVVSRTYIPKIIVLIKARILHRSQMLKQIAQLTKLKVNIPDEIKHSYPPRLATKLDKFKQINRDAFLINVTPSHPNIMKDEIDDFMFFECVVNRSDLCQNIEVKCYIHIPLRCPNDPPMFYIVKSHPIQSEAWRNTCELEEQINFSVLSNLDAIHYGFVLSIQVHHLLCCFEVFTDKYFKASDHAYPSLSRGRCRSSPFIYHRESGLFLHQ